MATKKTDTQFQSECKEFAEQRGIILIEGQEYQGTHHLYRWRCIHDGHEWQAPFVRIAQGKGCPVCGVSSTSNKNTITEEMFKQRIKERNEQFTPTVTYLSGYAGTTKKCWFKCDCCGNEWETLPKTIYTGRGCPKCGTKKAADTHTYTLNDVLALLVKRNDELPHKRVHLVETTFTGYRYRATFTCDHGHTWETKMDNVINAKAGCPHCSGMAQRKSVVAVSEIQSIHPNIKVISELGDILGRREEFEVECEYGHRWMATYERLVNGHYCPHCANRAKYTQEQFEAIVAETGSHVRVLGQYDGMTKQIEVQCTDCDHIWSTTANQISYGGGCPMCAKNNTYSKKSIEWLTQIETNQGIKIDHAVSGGEFRIPGTRYRVDGYHKESNTAYEFHGNYWHGNPNKHKPDDYNTITECTFGELYQRTLKKEAEIRALGYNLIVMWEDEFDKLNS